jgi:cellulose synthase/poly-beta-1,6-N-acetylglucosamine synthase-like glycosyltransferase
MMDLSTILDVLLTAIALVLLIPIGLLLLEVLSALRVPNAPVPGTTRPRVAIVMPAHNEASGISRSIGSILPQLTAADRLIVVADNCSDDTSTVASRTGAEVIVRNDAERRGKGYALDFGVRHLEKTNPPDVVIIIDADCRVADGTIDRIARLSHHTGRPVQSLYLMHAPVGASVKVRIAEFAWIVKNRVRPSGLLRLGLPCQLMGTGMAFPWECIRTAPLATGHIVEDLKLGIDLALAGTPPLFCREALVSSDFPTFAEGVQTQRTRWEHGHLSVIVSEAPKMLLHSLRRLDGRAFALALDLTIPPVALLTLLTLGVWSVSVIFFAWTRIQRPLVLGSIEALMLVGALMLSWWRYGREVISLRDMVSAVRYLIWKIPLYGRFLLARQVSWVRSKREHDSDDHPKENRP